MPFSNAAKKYTYTDYLTWSDEERWEIIDGEAYNMTPAPTVEHQKIVGNLYYVLRRELDGKRCVPGLSPLDVVLSEHDVVQPDIVIVCDRSKIGTRAIEGAPDVVIEVLSPSTSRKDRREKRTLYEKAGVREYLLVDPDGVYVERFILGKDGTYGRGEVYGPEDTLSLHAVEDVQIVLKEILAAF